MACQAQATVDLMNPYTETVLTITSDNGQEFAHPYYAWERGLSENTNGQLDSISLKGGTFILLP
jgi:IS30 family transposase